MLPAAAPGGLEVDEFIRPSVPRQGRAESRHPETSAVVRNGAGHNGGISSPFDAAAQTVPFAGGGDLLTLVDGRTFVISDVSGDVRGGVHGFVYDDLRHLSRFVLTVDGNRLTPIARATTSPFDALVVHRLHSADGDELSALLVRRRRIAAGLRDDLELWSTDGRDVSVQLTIEFGADFAHIFDVKAGAERAPAPLRADAEGIELTDPDTSAATRLRWDRAPLTIDHTGGLATWELHAGPGSGLG